MKNLLKALAGRLLSGYALYWIYRLDLDRLPGVDPAPYTFRALLRAEVEAAADEEMRAQAWYGGEDSAGFGLFEDGRLLCVQWYWFGQAYARRRGFWTLRPDQAKSVHLYTLAEARGRGLARILKRASALAMRERGFARLYSRIWITNASSIAVSEAIGWRRVALVIELTARGARRPLRIDVPLALRP
ncbi:MAG: N-acetyltransferase family protein [Gammaproteobacteria bacterium]